MLELVILVAAIVLVAYKLDQCEKSKKDQRDERGHHRKKDN